MPYIIITRRESGALTDQGWKYDDTRTAVATLDEAREAARKAQCGGYGPDTIRSLVGESGGTIGPLPDGTVIEVQSVEWSAIATANGEGMNRREALSKFNAA